MTITNEGKTYIKRFLAGEVAQIARSISFGIGEAAANAADKRLQFEVGRAPIESTSFDYVNNKVVFKCSIPQGLSAKITEIGLWSELNNARAGLSADRGLTLFDSNEVWSNTPAFSTLNTRIGLDSLRQSPAAGATISNELSGIALDLSPFSSTDRLVFAYNNSNTNVASVQVKIKTDDTNYYHTTFTNPTAGFHFDEVAKSAMTAQGAPKWSDIQKIEVTTVSKAGVVGTIDFDAISIVDVDTINPNYVLVARQIEPSFTVDPAIPSEIEFPLGITI
jgi:hypothetical protein